jgi:hypothetical protein
MVSPAPLIIAAVTIGAAFVSPLLIAPGAVAWLACVYFVARARAAGRTGRAGIDVAALPPTIRGDLDEVTTALDEIGETIRTAPRDSQVLFVGITAEAEGVRESVAQLALAAGNLHDYLASTADNDPAPPDREGLLEMLAQYRATMRELTQSTQGLRSTVARMAAGHALDTDREDAPVQQLDEMRASVAALEEVMSTSTMLQ